MANFSHGIVRTFPAVLKYGVGLSVAMYAFEYTGGSLFGYQKDREEDEFERRQKLRKAFQTPAEQTFAELGEGRGTLNTRSHELQYSENMLTELSRNLRTQLRGAPCPEDQGKLWHRSAYTASASIISFPQGFDV